MADDSFDELEADDSEAPEAADASEADDNQPLGIQAAAAPPVIATNAAAIPSTANTSHLDPKTMTQDQINAYLSSPANTGTPEINKAIAKSILDKEDLQNKYGSRPIEAGLESAARMASMGLSDPLLRKAGVSEERLKQVNEQNSGLPTAIGGTAGLVAGMFGPEEATAAFRAVEGVGSLAEKGMASLVEGRVRNNAVKAILKDVSNNAAQGAAIGAGNLLSEHALGDADLNGQSLVANMGAGAMLGVGTAGFVGGIKAAAPLIGKGIAPIAEKLASGAKNLADPELAAAELMNIKPKSMRDIEQIHPGFASDLPSYVVNKLDLGLAPTTEKFLAKNDAVLSDAGERIGHAIDKLEVATHLNPEVMPGRLQALQPLQDTLNEAEQKLSIGKEFSTEQQSAIDGYRKTITRLQNAPNSTESTVLSDLNDLRKSLQKVKFPLGGGVAESFKADLAEQMRSQLRNIIDNTATSVAAKIPALESVANDLKAANKDYSMAKTVEKYLPSKLNKNGAISLMDLARGGAVGALTHSTPLGAAVALTGKFLKSDMRRSAAILADIKGQNMAVSSAIKDAVSSFVNKTAKPAKMLATKSLLNSGFAVNYDTQKAPKNKQQAFELVSKNLEHLGDQDNMVNQLAKSTARISSTAPNIAQAAHNTLISAVNFLQSKVPKDPSPPNIFGRQYMPSSIEMAKFARYMQAVEHPMSVLQDLQNGSLTREHVEALQAVYPAIYEQLRQEAIDKAVNADSSLSYNKKVQLGTLLDIPTDPSLEPTNMAGLQANFMPQNDPMQVEAQQGAIRPNQGGLQKLNIASRKQTDVEQVANRKA